MSATEVIDMTLDVATWMATAEVERFARRVLQNHDGLAEFVMGMGTAFFTYKDSNRPRLAVADCTFVYMRPLREFLGRFDRSLYLTGHPMRFTAKGPVVTDW